MKQLLLKTYCVLASVLMVTAAPVALTVATLQTSCKAIPTTSQETSDQFILRAEQVAQTAKTTLNALFHVEKDNQEALMKASPAIHAFTEKMKKDNYAIVKIQQLRSATMTFKYNRNAANQATVNTYLSTVNLILSDANSYIAQSKTVTQP